jgi:hypothetical protein
MQMGIEMNMGATRTSFERLLAMQIKNVVF